MNSTDNKPGRPAGSTTTGITPLFSLRLDAGIQAWLRDQAKKNGDNAAAYVRRLIYQERNRVNQQQ